MKKRHGEKLIPLHIGLSFRWDETFIPNVVMCIGIVFVWRGLRNLMDIYFFPENQLVSNILAVMIGLFFIYLPDNSFHQLGGFRHKDKTVEKEIAKEVAKLID